MPNLNGSEINFRDKDIYNSYTSTKDIDNDKKAKEWAKDSMRVIITNPTSLGDLEDQWISFNNMIKKHRRESDWKSIELYGKPNQTRYEEMRDSLLDADIEKRGDEYMYPLVQDETPVLDESYIDIDAADSYYNPDAIQYTSKDVEKAKKWGEESSRIIIIPTRNIVELEDLWDAYNAMVKKHRRESDWTSQELFGVTNLKHYEYLKSQFLKNDISEEDKDYNMYMESKEETSEDIENNYDAFISNPEKSIEKYIHSISKEPINMIESVLRLYQPRTSVYEELIMNNIISDIMDNSDGLSDTQVEYLPANDMPLISPEEMIDMGVYGQSPIDNYFGAIADNSFICEDIYVKEWFEMYRCSHDGFYSEMSDLSPDWIRNVRELCFGLEQMKSKGYSKESINARKQSILELGWDPDIPFTNNNRSIARESAINRMRSNFLQSRIIDLSEFNTSNSINISESLDESNPLKAIYIVLVEGKNSFSGAIKKITHSIYSHAAISFDTSLKNMYTYGILNGHKGFRKEDIKDVPDDSNIRVYTFFTTNDIYLKMQEFVKKMMDNIEKTKYSYRNLITYLFNIPYNDEWDMICSQFVDRCMKIANIDITKSDSSFVTPAKLDRVCKKNRKIFTLFKDKKSKFKPERIDILVKKLLSKAKPIQESSYIDEASYINALINNINDIEAIHQLESSINIVINPYIKRIIAESLFDKLKVEPYCEAKSFPVQFDKDGNLFIKNFKRLDYEAEYAKSHKLLKEYAKVNNLDGMKYELSKLWMMICLIEESSHKKNQPSTKIANLLKAKAKLMNDFQYYMGIIMRSDSDFNFTKYFEDSPFSSCVTKINRYTLTYTADLIRKFMKSL